MADRKLEKSTLTNFYDVIASLKGLSTEAISLLISVLSVGIALASFVVAHTRETSTDLRNSTRDWQKGLIFSTLLGAGQPLTIDDIETRYRSSAVAVRDRFKLSDKEFSREEIYSILLDLLSNGSVKLRDARFFSVKTDDDTTQDRRVAFDMLQFALSNEYKYQYDNFASQFANWYSRERGLPMTKDRALSILSIGIQGNIIGMGVKPGTKITCLGETVELYVASSFSLRSNAPAILPPLQPCVAPKQ